MLDNSTKETVMPATSELPHFAAKDDYSVAHPSHTLLLQIGIQETGFYKKSARILLMCVICPESSRLIVTKGLESSWTFTSIAIHNLYIDILACLSLLLKHLATEMDKKEGCDPGVYIGKKDSTIFHIALAQELQFMMELQE